jgi:hypothetical protein
VAISSRSRINVLATGAAAGFTPLSDYSSLDGSPYETARGELIIVSARNESN